MTAPSSAQLLPPPFNWVDIPPGWVKIKRHGRFAVSAFKIAKYPITNTQYAKFVEARGYDTRWWWTETGWRRRERFAWTEPRYWDNVLSHFPDHPVVGVSWFEALAFCYWLSQITNTQIMLPTEDQWQRAAQGNDERKYPWGNEWDILRCNNAQKAQRFGGFLGIGSKVVKPTALWQGRRTTPVTAYEGLGDSPFGVVDMVGNVWEWCLTDHPDRSNEVATAPIRLLASPQTRLFRGGSWYYSGSANVRCDFRNFGYPASRTEDTGFRPVMLST